MCVSSISKVSRKFEVAAVDKQMICVRRSLDSIIEIIEIEWQGLCETLAALHLPKNHPAYPRVAVLLNIQEYIIEASLLLNEEFKTGLYREEESSGKRRKRVSISAISAELDAILRPASKGKGEDSGIT